jgi:carboxymethylenebutenolidase
MAADGEMPAVLHAPETMGRSPGVLVLMEAYGLTPHIEGVAARLAQSGLVALAPDLYYRFGRRQIGYGEADRAADMVMRTMALSDAPEERAKDDRVLSDIEKALGALAAHPSVEPSLLSILGFGMGGHLSFLAACHFARRLRAAVVFYGERIVPLLPQARQLAAPVLLLFGGRDAMIPSPQIDRIRAELDYLHKSYEIRVYPDAGHGFFCDERESYSPAAASEAWDETIGWLTKHLL